MLPRFYDRLGKLLKPNKVLVIYGPRRAGKTTLLQNFLKETKLKYRLDSGDNVRVQNILNSSDFNQIAEYVSGYQLIALDEAQQVPGVGMGLKIIVDQTPKIFAIATGSSSFNLAKATGEPLTGRKRTIILYPLAQKELAGEYNRYELKEKLPEFLVFGSYPEVLTSKSRQEKIGVLNELVDSYLLRDILTLEKVKASKILIDLLKLLAFQVGNQVSLNELATQLKIDVKTVGRYLDLLEKSFIIKEVRGFSRNLRKEVASKSKYYFLDNGVMNAVVSQFNMLEDRNDRGRLFENFIVMERLKKRSYEEHYGTSYFWRTYDGKEIDLIEEEGGKLKAFEIKWSEKPKVEAPEDFVKTYKNSSFKLINRDNYLDFVL